MIKRGDEMKRIEQEIIQKYQVQRSIKGTWKSLRGTVSEVFVRKVLISHGLYSCETSDHIQELYGRGYTPREIAKQLNISRASVNANLPYTKCVYKFEPSTNAQKVRRCRVKKSNQHDERPCL